MRILGIDPGTQYLGAGIVETNGAKLVHVANELLTPKDFDTLSDKLAYIFDNLTNIIVKYHPHGVSIENVFHGKNAKSAIILAHARAVAILAATKQDLPIFEYAPSQVKRAVGASGQASKDTVAHMVCSILGLNEIQRADCADALAIAICHLNRATALPTLYNTKPTKSSKAFLQSNRSIHRERSLKVGLIHRSHDTIPSSATDAAITDASPQVIFPLPPRPSMTTIPPETTLHLESPKANYQIIRRETPSPLPLRRTIVRKK